SAAAPAAAGSSSSGATPAASSPTVISTRYEGTSGVEQPGREGRCDRRGEWQARDEGRLQRVIDVRLTGPGLRRGTELGAELGMPRARGLDEVLDGVIPAPLVPVGVRLLGR